MAKTKYDLPVNLDAEKAVLCAMITSRDALFECLGVLDETSFFGEKSPNNLVYKAILAVNERGPVDLQTLTAEMIQNKTLDAAGGTEYLFELTQLPMSMSNVQHYLRIVKDNANLRNYLLTMEKIIDDFKSKPVEDLSEFIANADTKLRSVAEKRSVSEFKSVSEVAESVSQTLNNQRLNGNLIGLDTGFRVMNECTLGFQKEQLIIVAARPSVGKTQLALNLAYNVAEKNNVPVAFFSLEMPAQALVKRLVAAQSEINLRDIMLGYIPNEKKYNLNAAITKVKNANLFIDDSPNCKLADIVTKARKLKAAHDDLGMVVVDYLQIVNPGSTGKESSRQLEVSKVSMTLKQLARELQCPVLALAQINRKSEDREGKRPTMADLKDSGQIEQDADIIILLSREEPYKATLRTYEKRGGKMNDGDKSSVAKEQAFKELISSLGDGVENLMIDIAKNRNGQTKDFYLHFFKKYGSFVEPSKEFLDELDRIKQMGGDE